MSSTETLSADEAEAFRRRCREFLEQHARGIDYGSGERAQMSISGAKQFQAALTEAGLAGLTYATEYGGAGLTRTHDRIYREEYANFPDMTFELTISHGMCLPVGAAPPSSPLGQRGAHRAHRAERARDVLEPRAVPSPEGGSQAWGAARVRHGEGDPSAVPRACRGEPP